MQFLLILLYVVGGILALFLVTALLVKKDFSEQKEVLINCPRQAVFDYVKLIRNQEQYSVWVMRDPKIKIVYTGTDGTPGFRSSWESEDKNVGIGEQEIIKMQEGESIEVELRFKKPFEATNWARTRFETVGEGQTKVSQELYGRTKFPMNVMNLMMDKLVGKDMTQNFENLKKKLEI
ncbi:MAG: SRPBCC family protein [Chitinophagaceae bacterium]|nr:SRPBCC family protein [Chitinophagaceae bacterium]